MLTIFASQASLLIRNALLVNELQLDNRSLQERIERMRFGEILGASPVMQEVFRKVQKVAGTDISVLVTGETGTGKELIARELHNRSPRAKGPFVSINCGAIPENLLESELFGYVRGAFTGRGGQQDRALPGGQQGHAVPGRDRRDAAAAAGEDPARAAGPGGAAGGRHRPRADRHPGDRGHQPRAGGGDQGAAASARTSTTG